jgi:hypothetical protein
MKMITWQSITTANRGNTDSNQRSLAYPIGTTRESIHHAEDVKRQQLTHEASSVGSARSEQQRTKFNFLAPSYLPSIRADYRGAAGVGKPTQVKQHWNRESGCIPV